jgi:phospholipase/carboxylesterase
MIATAAFDSQFIPAQGSKSKTLLVIFHGQGDSLKPFRNFHQESGLRNINILLLNAHRPYLGGYTWFRDPPHFEKDLTLLILSVQELFKDLSSQGWKTSNTHLLGFSQGAMVAINSAIYSRLQFKSVISVSGYLSILPRWGLLAESSPQQNFIFTHGTKDKVLPLGDTQFVAQKLKRYGHKVQFSIFEKGHIFTHEDYSVIKSQISS